MRKSTFILILFLAVPVRLWAADFQAGINASCEGDYRSALSEFRPLAEKGHPGAQYELGQMYLNAHGVPRDNAAAARWVRLAAEQGHVPAQAVLAMMYEYGVGGLPEDQTESLKWIISAAQQGDPGSQSVLGGTFDRLGDYTVDEALRWYRLAAASGYAPAQEELGVRYFEGEGVPQDYVEAARWLQLAAEQGDSGAQKRLASMYNHGKGMSRDVVRVYAWYSLAQDGVPDVPIIEYVELYYEMTPEQHEQAKRLVAHLSNEIKRQQAAACYRRR